MFLIFNPEDYQKYGKKCSNDLGKAKIQFVTSSLITFAHNSSVLI